MWSDHEELLFRLERRRTRIMGAVFLLFPALLVVALMVHGAASHVAVVASLVALAATGVMGARWHLNGSTAEAYGAVARERRADRKHRLARREQAIRDGTWRPRNGS